MADKTDRYNSPRLLFGIGTLLIYRAHWLLIDSFRESYSLKSKEVTVKCQ